LIICYQAVKIAIPLNILELNGIFLNDEMGQVYNTQLIKSLFCWYIYNEDTFGGNSREINRKKKISRKNF